MNFERNQFSNILWMLNNNNLILKNLVHEQSWVDVVNKLYQTEYSERAL